MHAEDEWAYDVMLNEAMLELTHNGAAAARTYQSGSRHARSKTYDVEKLPEDRVIRRYCMGDTYARRFLLAGVGVIVRRTREVDKCFRLMSLEAFCAAYGAVVFCQCHHIELSLVDIAVRP